MNLRKFLFASVKLCRPLTVAAVFLAPVALHSATYYIAPDGKDDNAGTKDKPFATIMKAQGAASSGDTIYLRGGTYKLTNDQITQTGGGYAYVNYLTKNDLSYLSYPGENPVFDFTQVKPNNLRMCAFLVQANNLKFKGFEITGVQITIARAHTQSECIRVENGSNNTFDQLKMHDNLGIGIYIIRNSGNNLMLNCDAYHNYGLDSGSIGNSDGFGCHVSKGATGNVFRGCRSWDNSDDGYDCIHCAEPVLFDHCWSYHNGYQEGTPGGDGNGFKIGGWNNQTPPVPLPRHTVEYCLSVANKANGFYANHQPGNDAFWYDNSAYNNGNNFDLLERQANNVTDKDGTDEIMHNNLGYKARGQEVAKLNETGDMVSHNYWSLNLTAKDSDFVNLDVSQLTAQRQVDGSLPVITFMHLAKGSQFIDKGQTVDLGQNRKMTIYGDAPDLGCFEYVPVETPAYLTATSDDSKIVLKWTAPAGATQFNLLRSETSGSGYTAINSTTTTNTFTDSTVTNGKTYFYVVTATDGKYTSVNSNEASAVPAIPVASATPAGPAAATTSK
jgi:hypothetical protein